MLHTGTKVQWSGLRNSTTHTEGAIQRPHRRHRKRPNRRRKKDAHFPAPKSRRQRVMPHSGASPFGVPLSRPESDTRFQAPSSSLLTDFSLQIFSPTFSPCVSPPLPPPRPCTLNQENPSTSHWKSHTFLPPPPSTHFSKKTSIPGHAAQTCRTRTHENAAKALHC